MANITRALTPGEISLLTSVFSHTITYSKVKVHNYKAYFFQPDDTAMTPDGEIYFPSRYYNSDFSTAGLSDRAWFIHEGAHLYQYYFLNWSVKLRGIVDRNYNYTLVKTKKFKDYGLEEQGDIAADFYKLKQGSKISRPYKLSDYVAILPL
jgi:hypothetical protein